MEATLTGPNGRTVLGLGTLTVGRTPDNQLIVADAKASSHHADIRWDGQNYNLTDLGSTNGTFVNDQQLDRNVPRPLRSGDAVRIGDTLLKYTVLGVSSDPMMYSNPSAGSSPIYQPTVPAPQPFTGYGQGQGSQPPQPAYPDYGASQPQPYAVPPQPAYNPSQSQQQPYYGPPMNPPGIPGYVPTVPGPTSQPNRRGLWIGLGALAAVVVIGLVVFFVVMANASSPDKTLDTFCNALQNKDYQTAFNQLTTKAQGGTEAQFAQTAASVGLTCSHGSSTVNGNTAKAPLTLNFTLPPGTPLPPNTPTTQSGTATLMKDSSGNWKIDTIGQ